MSKKIAPMSPIEMEYRAVVSVVKPQIEEKLKEASGLIREAMELANDNDLPMQIVFGTDYNGFKLSKYGSERWKEDDADGVPYVVFESLMKLEAFDVPKVEGWNHSQLC